jgi:FkbM family methyltransferase
MDLRSPVKQALRMCGHAMASTIHDRLNAVDSVLREILEQNTHIAATQTALLQSSVHLVESVSRLKSEMETRTGHLQQAEERLLQSGVHLVENVAQLREEMVQAEGRIAAQISTGGAGDRTADRIDTLEQEMRTALESMERMLSEGEATQEATAKSLAVMEPVAQETSTFLTDQSVRQVCVETSDYLATNPEVGLFSFLYSYVPSRVVLDIGAHIGDVSDQLLQTGYDVYAFEPYPPSYNRLTERLGGRPGFHALNWALGSRPGEAMLHVAEDLSSDKRYEDATVFNTLARHGMPEDVPFRDSIPVAIKRLADLHKEGIVPADAGLVKIDTEGYDLEVVRGMEEYRYPVVAVEFWDRQIPFAKEGLCYTVESMVGEMRQRGYPWYIVIYRIWGQNHTAYYCNHDRSVPWSWGNIVFFRDRELFVPAQQWCSAVLPRTYFKHVAAVSENSAAAEENVMKA